MTQPPSPPPPEWSPWGPPTTPMGFAAPAPRHPTLPLAAGAGALAVLTLSLLGSKYVLDALLGLGWPIAVYVAVLAAVGYGPSVAWWWWSLGRWGTGDRFGDVGARPRWSDLGWGPLVWLGAVGVQVLVGAIVLALDVPLASNTDDVGELAADRTYAVAIVITAVIAAPLVEELVFRGLVMRSLLSKLPVVAAVILQGALFGVAHIDPVRGVGNVGLALVLSGVGISLGAGAYWLRRIGPTVVAHAIFNGVVMILLLTGLRDRLIENNPDVFDTAPPAAALAAIGSVREQIPIVDQPDVAEPDGNGQPRTTR